MPKSARSDSSGSHHRTPYVSRAAAISRGLDPVRASHSNPAQEASQRLDDLLDNAFEASEFAVENPEVIAAAEAKRDAKKARRQKRKEQRLQALPDSGSFMPGATAVAVASAPAGPLTLRDRFWAFFHYETVRIVRIRNAKVSALHIFVQLLILFYIVFYGLWIKKGYQTTAEASGNSKIKIQGTAYSNGTLPWDGPHANSSFLIWDAYDLISPVIEPNAFFVTSNMWVTRNQTRGKCPSYDKTNLCNTTHDHCSTMWQTPNGRQIGPKHCLVNFTDPLQIWPEVVPMGGYCELYAWCPTELEILHAPPHKPANESINQFQLHGVNNFTVFARISVRYDLFDEVLDNTGGLDALTPGLNSWTLEEMVHASGWRWREVNNTGILVALRSNWDCDFDRTSASECVPTIQFLRLDDPNSKLSTGYNFRTAEFVHDSIGARELTKHYGVRLIVLMDGVGARFDPVALFTAIGAGLGLLTIATMVADFIATKLLPQRIKYQAAKFREVRIEDPHMHLSFPFVGAHKHEEGESSDSESEGETEDEAEHGVAEPSVSRSTAR